MKKIQILLVEDNPGDVVLTREHLSYSKILHDLHVVADGVEAMAFIHKEGKYKGSPRPDLILLDLNIPKKNGQEVLMELKSDGDVRRIPVVILTSSTAERDIILSYDLNASAYVTKPVDLVGFGEIVRAIEGFWFNVVRYSPDDKGSK